jgi:uncharacterized protein
MDKIVHFEIPYDDKDRAIDFYKNVFDWGIEDMPEMNYTMVRTVGVDEKQMPVESGAINGGMFKRAEDLKNTLLTINVESVDDALEGVKSGGGEIVREKSAVGDMGFIAYFKDTEGNVVGLWEDNKEKVGEGGEGDEEEEVESGEEKGEEIVVPAAS